MLTGVPVSVVEDTVGATDACVAVAATVGIGVSVATAEGAGVSLGSVVASGVAVSWKKGRADAKGAIKNTNIITPIPTTSKLRNLNILTFSFLSLSQYTFASLNLYSILANIIYDLA